MHQGIDVRGRARARPTIDVRGRARARPTICKRKGKGKTNQGLGLVQP